jgi:hypothetical protein
MAKASEPLEIVNKALGYKIILDLKEFRLYNNNEVNYYGYIRFEELIPEDKDEQSEWEEKREEAYYGSFRHFLISLSNSELIENEFYTYKVDYPYWDHLRRRDFPNPHLSETVKKIETIERVLQFDDYVMVVFRYEWEENDFLTYRNNNGSNIFKVLDYQTSWIKLPYGNAMFDVNGNIIDYYKSIKVFGYWAWQKVADLLPTNYFP